MSGVGAHHQNAVAKCNIGTYVEDIWNCMPDIKAKMSPMDVFSGTMSDHTDILNLHMSGCSAYVLNTTLQDGKKLPKWSPRKQKGQFLEWSKDPASSVAFIRNLNTGSITPQFHTVMDD
eukprot:12592199-Ditylum_brightwellii.AAC.1